MIKLLTLCLKKRVVYFIILGVCYKLALAPLMCSAHRSQKRELELQSVVSCPVAAENWTWGPLGEQARALNHWVTSPEESSLRAESASTPFLWNHPTNCSWWFIQYLSGQVKGKGGTADMSYRCTQNPHVDGLHSFHFNPSVNVR